MRGALKVCTQPGCPNLTPHTRCKQHRRPNAHRRGYNRTWQATRQAFLAANPTCISCGQPATEVDHKDGGGPNGPHGHDWANLAPYCKPCHARKTVTHDAGLGRSPRPPGAPPTT